LGIIDGEGFHHGTNMAICRRLDLGWRAVVTGADHFKLDVQLKGKDVNEQISSIGPSTGFTPFKLLYVVNLDDLEPSNTLHSRTPALRRLSMSML
jgi:hypothetical protein